MLRMMTAAALCLAMPLAGCVGTPAPGAPAVDLCKGAAVRRQVYLTAIAVADAYTATGRPVPAAVDLGREAATTALAILDLRCPQASR